MGNTTVFGRKSFEEIVKMHGRGLKGRINVVLSKSGEYVSKHGEIVFNDAQKIVKHHETNTDNDKKIMICGGERVYEEFLPYADEIILTHVNKHVENVDTFYPIELQESLGFIPVEESELMYDELEDVYYRFVKYSKNEQ